MYSIAEEAAGLVRSGDRVYIGTLTSTAYRLTDALLARRNDLEDVTICSGNLLRRTSFADPENEGHFRFLTYFAGPGERPVLQTPWGDYTSIHISQVESWLEETARPDIAFIEVSQPDEEGHMSLGLHGAALHLRAVELAKEVVFQVNPRVPFVDGIRGMVDVSQCDLLVEAEDAVDTVPNLPLDETLKAVADQIVARVPDGAVLQFGIGGISSAVGFSLQGKNDLSIHSEMFSDSMMTLMKNGNVTNRNTVYAPGKALAVFGLGTLDLYHFLDHNHDVLFAPYKLVNDPALIGRNPRFVSVNSAMAVDLYGQCASDNMGGRQISAVGGQLNFVRGAQLSEGGKSFIALTARTTGRDGRPRPRIVAAFPPATAVTTPRSDVQYVCTEYGCVNLKPLPARARAEALISLAHPDDRDKLREEGKRLGILPSL